MLPRVESNPLKTELVFLLDRSGSMSGTSIDLLKEAMLTMLKSLPRDCYVNIVGFGSQQDWLFEKSARIDEHVAK